MKRSGLQKKKGEMKNENKKPQSALAFFLFGSDDFEKYFSKSEPKRGFKGYPLKPSLTLKNLIWGALGVYLLFLVSWFSK